jgi:predicted MFS family arabinose efflux permease
MLKRFMSPSQTEALGRTRSIFRGWWIVAAAIIGQSFGLATVLVYTFGVFVKPLAEEFRTSRGSIALAVSLLDVAVTFSAPGVGRLVDRHGTRKVIVMSALALAACLAGLSLVQPPLWHLYALYVLAGTLGIATTPVTFSRVVANWFDRRRGIALGLASTGVGLGVFIGPSLAQFLIEQRGWRQAYLDLAGFSLLVVIPAVAIFLVSRPEEVGQFPEGASAGTAMKQEILPLPGIRLSEALRMPTFWLLCAVFFVVAASANGMAAHIAPMLSDRGFSGRSAALAVSLFGLASIIGRVVNGYLVDRFFAPRVVAVVFSAAAGGLALLWSGANGNLALLASLLVGMAVGAEADVMPFLISRYFGMGSMAELYGCALGSYTLGNATGRYLFAAGYDATASYKLPLAVAFAALLIATLGTFALGKYRLFPSI